MPMQRVMYHSLHIFHTRLSRKPLSVATTNGRNTFMNNMLQQLNTGAIDALKIWVSDEVYFSLDGFANNTWRISGTENVHVAAP